MANLQDLLKQVDSYLKLTENIESIAPNSQDSELQNALDENFGYRTFRHGQQEIIESILNGENVFCCLSNWSRKIVMLSITCLDVARHNGCCFTTHIIDERSSRCFAGERNRIRFINK